MMAKYETAWAAKINGNAYRDHLSRHPDADRITLTRAQMEVIIRHLCDYTDRDADATAWAEQATRSAARIAELEAERDELARIQDEAEWVMDVTLTALHCIAGERYDGPAWHCNCHWCGGPDRAHHSDCPTVIARQALRESLKKDGAERIAELEHELRVARGMAIVQRVIAEGGGG
jgi:hypothetical protein